MKKKELMDVKKNPKKIRKRAFELEKEFSHLFVGTWRFWQYIFKVLFCVPGSLFP